MTQQIINVGTAINDGTGDPARTAFTKSNANFTELYAANTDFPAGAWTAWSPAITASVGTITSMTINRARYTRLGKTIIANLDVTISDQGTGAGVLFFGLPVAASASGGGIVSGREVAITGVILGGHINPSGTIGGVNKYDGSTIIATTFQISVIATYEGV